MQIVFIFFSLLLHSKNHFFWKSNIFLIPCVDIRKGQTFFLNKILSYDFLSQYSFWGKAKHITSWTCKITGGGAVDLGKNEGFCPGQPAPAPSYFARFWRYMKYAIVMILEKCFSRAVEAFKVWTSKRITTGRKFSNEFWWLKQFTNISVLFQKQSMRHVWHFKFLRIFHCNLWKHASKRL